MAPERLPRPWPVDVTMDLMTAAKLRMSLLTLGSLCAAFGVIYAFTPGGFSWGLVLIGTLMMSPWLLRRAKDRRLARPAAQSGVPTWHPEHESG